MVEGYYIAVRKDPEVGFVLIARTDSVYAGLPEKFEKDEMLRKYAELVVEHGGKNVVVSEVKYFCLTGRAEEVSERAQLPWTQEGKFIYKHE